MCAVHAICQQVMIGPGQLPDAALRRRLPSILSSPATDLVVVVEPRTEAILTIHTIVAAEIWS